MVLSSLPSFVTTRLDDELKERVRAASDILDVVEQCVPLKRAGTNFKACCPFHEEKTPSFNVNPARQFWHCFGCGAGGDVFEFVMQHHGMSFPEALRYLAQRAGIALPARNDAPRAEVGRDEMLAVYARYAAWYRDQLLRQPVGELARAYLKARGIHVDAAKEFGLGFAPDEWAAARDALADLDAKHVQAAGLAKPRADGSLYDLFRNRIIIPIHGPAGDIVAFGGRTLGEDPAKYINSPETPVYHKGGQLFNLYRARRDIRRAGRVILVEGYFDAVRLAGAGFPETVATCGTALTPQQATLLTRHTDRVVVAYDGDAAGCAAAERAAALLLAAGLDVGFVTVPGEQDPDDYLRDHGSEAFGTLVNGARDFVDFLLRDTDCASGLDIEARVAYADRLSELVAHITHPTRRKLYREKIAGRLGLQVGDLQAARNVPAPAPADPVAAKPQPVRLREAEREILRFVLANLTHLREFEGLEDACADMQAPVPAIVHCAATAQPPFDSPQALLAAVAEPATERVLRELQLEPGDRRRYVPEWWHHHMKRRVASRTLPALKVQLAEAERAGDEALVHRLLGEIQALIAARHASTEALHSFEEEKLSV